MEIETVKREVANIIKGELPRGYSAFFFGSRITGTAGKNSDLDVGIESQNGQPVPSALMRKVKGEIETLPTLYTIDVVDFSTVGEDFKKVAKEKFEPIV